MLSASRLSARRLTAFLRRSQQRHLFSCTVVSNAKPIDIPTDLSLFDLMRGRANWSEAPSEQAALTCGATGATVSYFELEGRVLGAGHALQQSGFQQGDILAIHIHNCNEWVIGFLATAACGGTSTASSPSYTSAELANQLRDSGASYMLTAEAYRAVAEEAAQMVGIPSHRIAFIEDKAAFVHAPATSKELALQRPISALTDLLTIPYSSGTTGAPKGVMLSHFNVVANALQVTNGGHLPDSSLRLTDIDRILAVLPFYHIYGMCVLLVGALLKRASIVIMPSFEPQTFLTAIQDHRITKAHLVPPIILFLAKADVVSKYDLSSLETVFSGAAPLSQATADALSSRLGLRVSNGYGLTEASPVICSGGIEHGSSGFLLPNISAKVIDLESGEALPRGSEGELCVLGPNNMMGYWNRPEATSEAFTADGWLRTGDMARIDAQGNVIVGDRLKEFIKVKAFQVAPAELEGALLEHDEVLDACVVGVPDDRSGEAPKAFVVRKNGSTLTVDDLSAMLKSRLAEYKQPREIHFVQNIPKSPAGKILRRLLL